MWTRRILHLLPLSAFAAFLALAGAGAVVSAREHAAFEAFRADVRSVTVIAPAAKPRLRQESIEIAMALFSIEKAPSVMGPRLDRTLEDRGLTTGGTLSTRKTVTIGPSAFTSWGVLGSTLGHEIEVHARQSFLAVVLRDRMAEVQLSARRRLGAYVTALNPSARESFENDGTWRAEREAYMYELANAGRFGLSPAETRSIAYVMNYYYPDPPRSGGHDALPEASGTLEDARETSASLKNEAL